MKIFIKCLRLSPTIFAYRSRGLHLSRLNPCNVRVRFAPSPTGNLHLGGLRTALINYAFAKSHSNGKFILRIEDTDQTRLIPGIAEKIEDVLQWANLSPDESPSLGGEYGPYVQSQRLEIYQKCAQELINNGNAYKCFCSDLRLKLLRKEQLKNKQKSMYDGNCRNLSSEELQDLEDQNSPYTIRLKMKSLPSFVDMVFGEIKLDPKYIEGDPIIMKSDGFPTYNFANVVDDHYMNITHVFRGEELMISTPKHLLIYNAFGWHPPKYGHLPLLKGPDGAKLSKRHGAQDIHIFKDEGFSPEAILNFLSYSGGAFRRKNCEFHSFSTNDLLQRFDIAYMNTRKAIADIKQLPVFSRNYILHLLSSKELCNELLIECRDILNSKYGKERIDNITDEFLIHILKWDELTITHPKQLVSAELSYLWEDNSFTSTIIHNSETIIKDFIKVVENASNIDSKVLLESVEGIREKSDTNKREFYAFIRQVLTNKKDGPPLLKIVEVLGKERILNKLKLIEESVK